MPCEMCVCGEGVETRAQGRDAAPKTRRKQGLSPGADHVDRFAEGVLGEVGRVLARLGGLGPNHVADGGMAFGQDYKFS